MATYQIVVEGTSEPETAAALRKAQGGAFADLESKGNDAIFTRTTTPDGEAFRTDNPEAAEILRKHLQLNEVPHTATEPTEQAAQAA